VTRCCRKKNNVKIKSTELTELEKQILEEISLGKSYATIANELSLKKNSIQKYVRVIYEKLQEKKRSDK
jgi:DNA-binding NarL/FixJ family response regulator